MHSAAGLSDSEGTPASGHRFILLTCEQRLEALTLDFGRVRRDRPRRGGRVAEAHALTEERIDERLRRLSRGPARDGLRVVSKGINVAIVVRRMGESGVLDHCARIHRRDDAEHIRREGAMVQPHASRGQTNALRACEDVDRRAKALVELAEAGDFKRFLIHCATPLYQG
jgi:hypothetical protein